MPLTIRPDQMTILERMRFVQQAHALYPALEKRHPETCARLGEANGVEMLMRALEKAFKQGFREPRHASIYADLTLRWGENFGERLPWAAEVLAATQVPADLRASELLERSNAAILDQYLGDEPEPPEMEDLE